MVASTIEPRTSHSPFLSKPEEVVEIVLDDVNTASALQKQSSMEEKRNVDAAEITHAYDIPMVRFDVPSTWLKFGMPFLIGRILGWGFLGFLGMKRMLGGR